MNRIITKIDNYNELSEEELLKKLEELPGTALTDEPNGVQTGQIISAERIGDSKEVLVKFEIWNWKE